MKSGGEGMKKVVFLFLLGIVGIVILAGCSGKELKGDTPPMPIVRVGGENIEVVRGSYCWNTSCVDYAGPPELLEGKMPFQVQKGEEIKIEFDFEPKPSSIELSRMIGINEGKWIKDNLVNDVLTAPNEEGIYYYDFMVHWYSEDKSNSLGDSSYAFVIEVK